MIDEKTPASSVSTTGRNQGQRLQLSLIYGLYLLVGLNSGAFGVILPNLQASYHLDKATAGLLFLMGTGGYVLAAFVSGWLKQRLGLSSFMTAGLCLFGVCSLILGLEPLFLIVLLLRVGLGMAMAALETGGNFYVTALPNNTGPLNYLHAFFGAGALLGPLVATLLLGQPGGWHNVFFAWAALCLLLIGGVWLVFRPAKSTVPATSETVSRSEEAKPAEGSMLDALRLPVVWLMIFFLLIYCGLETSVGNWTYTYLTEGQGQPADLAGWLVSAYWLGLTLGRLALAFLAGRLKLTDQNRTLLLLSVLGSLAGSVLVWLAGSQPVLAALGLVLVGFCFGPIYPTTLALLSERVAGPLLSHSIALLTGLSIVGIALFPWLAGVLLQIAGATALAPYVLVLAVIFLLSGLPILRPAARRG